MVKSQQRKPVHVDAASKEANLKRLRRIEGQVRGLQHMIENDRYCADILIQIASVQEALRGVGRVLMRNHLNHCVAHALQSGDERQAQQTHEELLDLIYKHLR